MRDPLRARGISRRAGAHLSVQQHVRHAQAHQAREQRLVQVRVPRECGVLWYGRGREMGGWV